MLPLRPVLISPLVPEQTRCVAGDRQPEGQEALDGGPSVTQTVPFLYPDHSLSMAMLPDAEVSAARLMDQDCITSEHGATAPVSSLFCAALKQAPEAAVSSVRQMFEELHPNPSHCVSHVKQLYIAVLERQGTYDTLMKAVNVLAGCPSHSDELTMADWSLHDLIAAVNFVTRHSGFHGDKHNQTGSGEMGAALWNELVRCSSGPRRVLVQYFKSQLSTQELIRDGTRLSENNVMEQVFSSMDGGAVGSDVSTVLLKDAAPAISSLMRTVQGQSTTLSLERYDQSGPILSCVANLVTMIRCFYSEAVLGAAARKTA